MGRMNMTPTGADLVQCLGRGHIALELMPFKVLLRSQWMVWRGEVVAAIWWVATGRLSRDTGKVDIVKHIMELVDRGFFSQ